MLKWVFSKIKPLGANPTKWSNTNSVFDYFMGSALKGLIIFLAGLYAKGKFVKVCK